MANYGVSPLLVEMLTGKKVEEPSIDDLSCIYSNAIHDKLDNFPMINPKHEVKLKCLDCGHSGTYDVGKIIINREKFEASVKNEEALQFTGYFRCEHCNGAGNWEITEELIFRATTAILGSTGEVKDERYGIGSYMLYDGTVHQFPTDAEAYLFKKLNSEDAEDDPSLIWNKLGNVYWTGNRPDLAVAAFERSIELDSGQTESHFTLGQILISAKELSTAAKHLRSMLVTARQYKEMEALELRNLLAFGLMSLFLITARSDEIQGLPTREEMNLSPDESMEFGDIFKIDFKPDLSDVTSFYPVAEIFMGKRGKELSREDKTYTPVVSIHRLKQRKLQQKRRKKKKKK